MITINGQFCHWIFREYDAVCTKQFSVTMEILVAGRASWENCLRLPLFESHCCSFLHQQVPSCWHQFSRETCRLAALTWTILGDINLTFVELTGIVCHRWYRLHRNMKVWKYCLTVTKNYVIQFLTGFDTGFIHLFKVHLNWIAIEKYLPHLSVK